MTSHSAVLQQINQALDSHNLAKALELSQLLPACFEQHLMQNTIAMKLKDRDLFDHSMAKMIQTAESLTEKDRCFVAMADFNRAVGNSMKALDYYAKAFRIDPTNQQRNLEYLDYALKQLHATDFTLKLSTQLVNDADWAAKALHKLISFAYRFNNKTDLETYFQLIKERNILFSGSSRVEIIEVYIRAQLSEQAAFLRSQYAASLNSLELTILDCQSAVASRDFAQAIALIDQLDIQVLNRIPYLQYVRGNAMISMKQHEQGFHELIRASQAHRANINGMIKRGETPCRNLIADVDQHFDNRSDAVESTLPPDQLTGPSPIFMVGFPRSGTTLLERMIDTHPELTTINEKPMIDDVRSFMEQQLGLKYPESLPSLTVDQVNLLRSRYWETLHKMSAIPNGVQPVDKHPWAINQLPLIASVFPDAKVIVCLRHPMDCVYSCFRQNFISSFENNQIITINECAKRYVEVMDFYDELKPFYPFELLEVAYEHVVSESEAQISKLFEFLAVPYDSGFKHFNEHAKQSAVTSASLYQVTQPLYTSAIHSWSPIRQQLQEPLGILARRIEIFSKIINL
ncbi:sulfotransferase [uncultured Umboniibacter sp.]|uniref:sulfotransferase family protein n=1 Tax=uncultured Umboniibacter sp. TaxID=1798917 RepID=UPI0026356641|nr:sulfotransferase [uncultured Umboniibacter sp.]